MSVRLCGLGALLVTVVACGGTSDATTPPVTAAVSTTRPVIAVRASGNGLVDAAGRPLRLRGVNHSGSEYACIQGRGIFDGPTDSAAVSAIAAWKANVVRVPLNESCWLGIDGVKPEYGGANYQQAIAGYVARLNAAGFAVILELDLASGGEQQMPNRARSPEFWRQVATAYRGNPAVVFDLFNAPFPDGDRDTPEAWRCWRDGGTCAGMSVPAAGMQELVTVVRATGATNLVLVGGVQYANSLTGWLADRPADPANNLAAAWHVFSKDPCNTTACWDSSAAAVARQAPLVLGEFGDVASRSAFVLSLMDWMDARQGSYLPWTWNVWGTRLDLITKYDGTPTVYGESFRARFAR